MSAESRIRSQSAAHIVAVFCVLWFTLCYVHQRAFNSDTPVSRLDLLFSIVEDGVLNINRFEANTLDKAYHNGYFYSDKAPGMVMLALPGFFVGYIIAASNAEQLSAHTTWLISSWMSCGWLAIIVVIGSIALYRLLLHYVPPRTAFLTSFFVLYGGPSFPYSTILFSHAVVIALISIAIAMLHSMLTNGCRLATRWAILAGFVLGWGLNSEFSSGIVVFGIAIAFLWNRPKLWLAMFGGMIWPLTLIPAYSWLTIGSPISLPYSYQASFPEMQQGLYAIQLPDPATALQLLCSPERGFFFWSPFLLLSFLGSKKLLEKAPRIFLLCFLASFLHIIIISGRTWDWQAGSTFGARLLSPIVPLLAIPAALGLQNYFKVGLLLGVYSVLITTLATLTNACPGFLRYPNPLLDCHIPLLLRGDFSPNLGSIVGLPGYISIVLFYTVLCGFCLVVWKQLPGTLLESGVEPKPILTFSHDV